MIEKDIKATIAYAARYGNMLTSDQLARRLISPKRYSNEEIKRGCRKARYGWARGVDKNYMEKIGMAKELGKRLGSIRWILMVGVTGSVAAGYPKKESDIDLMIICKRNRLWLSRLMVKIWLAIKKIPSRRKGRKERKDEYCFNMWVDEAGLMMPIIKQNERSAVDLVMMMPVFNRNGGYDRWIETNWWAKRWVASGLGKIMSKIRKNQLVEEERNWLLDVLNLIAFLGQYLYMRPGMRGEVVGLHEAYFHP